MRLIRISLAAKYRILFGLAVLLIIGAALAVPWYRMELLVLGQPFNEAQRIVEDYYQLVLPEPGSVVGKGGVHSHEFSLLPEKQYHQASFVRLNLNPDDLDSLADKAGSDPFLGKAVRTFVRNPNQSSVYRSSDEEGIRRFSYAHAVRVTKRCLSCHGEAKTASPFQENQLAGVIMVHLPADPSARGVFWNRLVVIAAGALAGILAILVFYIITQKFILAPIQQLRQVTIRVAEGDLDIRSAVETGDEFEQLSGNLNTMLERLRSSQEELKKANRLLDEKLGQMAESNVALYEANRVKSEFLANVSHELRTPLTTIIGFAELLREGPQAEAGSRTSRYSENILISGRILLEIINDLLDLAKIEAGKVELRIEPLGVRDLCAGLVDFMRPLAEKKNIEVVLDADGALPVIHTDQSKLRQILYNLLSNAIKFTPDGGEVRLTARRLGERHVRLAVRDTGPGIAPEHHETIFEKFRQIDQSATREHHGTGLGLAIAKELAHLLGGELDLESTPGHGSTFWISLGTEAPEPREPRPISLV